MAVEALTGVAQPEVAPRLVELLHERSSFIQPIDRRRPGVVVAGGDGEATFGADADVWLGHVELLLQQRLGNVCRRLALEGGPDGVVRAAEEGGVGAGAVDLAGAL